MVKQKERIDYLDAVRGVAIFLVLWGHSIQNFGIGGIPCFEDKVFQFIYSFHMPLFMLISGYFFYFSALKRNIKELINGRMYSIGVPIFVWGTALFLLDFVVSCVRSVEQSNLLYVWYENIKNVWFLWSVLICSVVMACISKVKKSWLQFILCIFVMPIFLVLPNKEFDLYMYPYFVIGYFSNKYGVLLREIWKKSGKILCPLMFITYSIMLAFFKEDYFIYTTGIFSTKIPLTECLVIDLYRWTIGVLGSVLVIGGIRYIYSKKWMCGLKNILVDLGKHSLEIYVVQRIILEYLAGKSFSLFVEQQGKNFWVSNLVLFDGIISVIIAVLAACVIRGFIYCCGKISYANKILFAKNK